MADIRVERKGGGRAWLWVLLVIVLLILAAVLLARAGYIDLPGMADTGPGGAALAQLMAWGLVSPQLQEV